MKTRALILILSFFILSSSEADVLFEIKYKPGEKFKITEISDFRRRVNGKYAGFSYRQIRGILDVVEKGKDQPSIRGDFYLFQETKQNGLLISNQIDRVVSSEFIIHSDGKYTVPEGIYFPSSRDFPVFPAEPVKKGETWKAFGIRYVDPYIDGTYTKVQFYCEYKYEGIASYKGTPFHMVTGQYAMRYNRGDDPEGDPRIKAIKNGGHRVVIYFDLDSRKPVFMKDNIIENLGGEVYVMVDSSQIVLKGFTQTWFDTITPLARDQIVDDIKKDVENLEKEGKNPVQIREMEKGIVLTLPDIRFYPDSALFLPEEEGRLDMLAKALKKIEGRTFLVRGHTADVGNPEGEYRLSVERAKALVDRLVAKGIAPQRFLYEGKGALEPLVSSNTPENQAQNRRVEVIIMED